MSFVTTQPESLAATATNLEGIGAAMTAQNSAAAAPITGVIPAGADEVSALQATQFAAYGTLYEQVSAQATAIQEMFVQNLRSNADTYDAAENANAAASTANAAASGAAQSSTAASAAAGTAASSVSDGSNAAVTQVSNFGSAASDLLQLGSSGFLAPGALSQAGAATAVLTGSTEPVTSVNVTAAAPVTASAGQAASAGRLSVPPSWVNATEPVAGSAQAPMRAAGWSAPAHNAPMSTVPAGLPAAASAERGGYGFGRPRYGVKPTVMPRPTVV